MKKPLFLLALSGLLLLAGCDRQPHATIEGTIAEAAGKMLYLDAIGVDRITVADSVKLKDDGTFAFRVPQPECYDFYRLRIDRERITVSIDSTETISVTATLPTMSVAYQVDGSEDNMKLKNLVMKQMELQNEVLQMARNSGPETGVTRQRIAERIQEYKDEVRREYIYADPSKPYAYYALFQRLGNGLIFDPVTNREDVKAFAAVATNLDIFYPGAVRTRNLHNIAIKGMSNTRPARTMTDEQVAELESKIVETDIIDINLTDVDGAERKLTDLKGQVVLVNFTAYMQETSAASILNLREIYADYADRGFQIYQVALDDNEHYWRMAVDALPWICVRDAETQWFNVNGNIVFNSRVASMYGVRTLPTSFLVNRDGQLIVRIEDEAALRAEIEKLL